MQTREAGRLGDVASYIRSKNAGPFWLTIDIFFANEVAYEKAVSSCELSSTFSLYGAFKVLGETVLRTYYDQLGIESVSVRIGTCRQAPIDQRSLATWLSFDDLAQTWQ